MFGIGDNASILPQNNLTRSFEVKHQISETQADEGEYGDVDHQYTNNCNHLSQELWIAREGPIGAVNADIRVRKQRVADETNHTRDAMEGENIHSVAHVLPAASGNTDVKK